MLFAASVVPQVGLPTFSPAPCRALDRLANRDCLNYMSLHILPMAALPEISYEDWSIRITYTKLNQWVTRSYRKHPACTGQFARGCYRYDLLKPARARHCSFCPTSPSTRLVSGLSCGDGHSLNSYDQPVRSITKLVRLLLSYHL